MHWVKIYCTALLSCPGVPSAIFDLFGYDHVVEPLI
jgi:hypothetical protein